MDETDVTLADLPPGESATIVLVEVSGSVLQRLLDFGLRQGEEVMVIRTAPLSDPIELKVCGGYITLRRGEASRVRVRLRGGHRHRRRGRQGRHDEQSI